MINNNSNHIHTYDAQGRITCCSEEEKIYAKANATDLLNEPEEKKNKDKEQKPSIEQISNVWKPYFPAIASFVMLIIGITLDYYFEPRFFAEYVRLIWYIIAYLPVGLPVIKAAVQSIRKGAFFSEFF